MDRPNRQLVRLRRALGCSQEAYAALVGATARQVRNWEAGKVACPQFCYLDRMHRLHGTSTPEELGFQPHAHGVGTVPGNSTSMIGDSVRRRDLLATTAGAAAAAFAAIDVALVVTPEPAHAADATDIAARLARARIQYDNGDLVRLAADLPDLIAAAHLDVERHDQPAGHARLASLYALSTEALHKLGHRDGSRITADRAVASARLSGSPVAAAVAAKSLTVVLRHDGQAALADRVIRQAANRLEATGLRDDAQRSAYAQLLCTASYTAAVAGDRDRALELIADARRAATGMTGRSADGRFRVDAAAVALYRVSVHWSLGDAGAALAIGQQLRASDLPTPERRGRLFTDLARAWWQWGKPEQAARALLVARSHAPSELDRTTIRAMALDIVRRHPRTPGVANLAQAIGAT